MLRIILFFLLLVLHGASHAASLQLGVVPYLSARSLLLEHAPLKSFLESRLHQPVNLGSARNPDLFVGRVVGGEFDVALLPPHIARLLQSDYGYLPLQGIRADFYALVLVNKQDPAVNIADLKGRALNLPHHLSLVALQIDAYLRRLDVDPDTDLQVRYHSTDNNAVLALAGASRGAAATSRTVFERMPAEIGSQLRILGSTPSVVSLVFVANPRLKPQQLDALRGALDEFPYSEAGLAFFQQRGINLVPLDAAELKIYDPLLPALRKGLREFLP